MAATPEGRVKAAIKKVLKEYGIWYYMPVQNGMGVTGIPDFICCMAGRFLGVEAKAPGGKLTPNQTNIHGLIREQGGTVITVDDASQLREFLDNC
jgi:hypothetical protein